MTGTAAGIELPLGNGIDVKCNNKDSGAITSSLEKLLKSGGNRAEIDAFKLWLAFIDHGDTKADNQRFSCLESKKNADGSRMCKPDRGVYYVADMGSTFGFSSASEKKARLTAWKGKDPIKVNNGRSETTAKSVGDAKISEVGRKLLANGLQRLLDAEKTDTLITKVFRASRQRTRSAARSMDGRIRAQGAQDH
jgi:hypothetical protein